MTVEETRRDCDNFPVGMRVLAVDDDPICLKLLETLLRKCQYHVTATSQARMALKMLRENKDRFDLVISDVHMPDMDGFKLLELVGLEMDLPVIMLSANSDPKLVMKGVTHGACDYLVKPIRIEELRNIWQHVLRRKRFDGKNQNNNNKGGDQVRAHQASGEGNGPPLTGNMDQNGKFNRKRKDEEDENEDDNENESDDPSTQKKPRVVWSIELHRKFVGAVNQLGIEKAVPKRILDLMNVDGLTRENVASHLQKYRLYLKRISSVTSQQANMAAALGVKDSPFMRMGGSLDGLGDFRTFQQARLSNVALSSSSPFTSSNGMLGRLNSPAANLNLRNLTQSSSLVQPSQAQNLSNSITSLGRMNLVLSPVTQSPSLFQGIPSSLEMDQKGPTNFNTIDNLLNGGAPNNSMMLHGIGNQSGHNMNSFNSEPFDVSGSSNLLDPLNTFESSSKMQPNPLLSSSGGPYLQNNPIDLFEDSRENYTHSSSNGTFGSFNSSYIPANGVVSPLTQRMDTFVNGRSDSTNLLQQNENEKLVTESRMRSNEDIFLEQPKVQGGFLPQSYDSLDELMNAMIKREQDETISNCGFGFDNYSFGPGI